MIYKILSMLFTLFFGIISFQFTHALENLDTLKTLSDEALCHRASELKLARHVVCLEAEISIAIFKKTVYTGSAVCIGNGSFLTNAHCFVPWCDAKGELKYPLYINTENHGKSWKTQD